ncbi:Uncharacterized protein GBIM_10769 [Gryllus bimaculatus]|nr:Uncharacterized protein GBIM_10769 [Gryllus bimaculatus]
MATARLSLDENTLIQPKKSKEITISNLREGKEDPSIIRLKTTDEQQKWIRCLVQHTKDHFRWKHAAENNLSIRTTIGQQFKRYLV